MTVVRITIKKELERQGQGDLYRHAPAEPFASEYLVRTDAPFPSQQLEDYARSIAVAEGRLYPAFVRFEGAIVRLATPGASTAELSYRYSHVGLEELAGLDGMHGQLEMPEGEVLAFPPVTAVYIRQARRGRNGRLAMRHALTTTEWNLYTQQRVLPARFQRPSDFAPTAFSDELIAAIRPANGTYVMPAAQGDTEESLRQISSFFFSGFDVNSLKKRKKKPSLAAKRAAQLRARLLGGEEEAEGASPGASRSTRAKTTKAPVAGVVYLLKAGPFFKIGKSIDLEKRLSQIKLQLPYAVEVVHVIQAAHPLQAEAQWHRRFAAKRQNGEWFELGEGDVAEFKGVSEM